MKGKTKKILQALALIAAVIVIILIIAIANRGDPVTPDPPIITTPTTDAGISTTPTSPIIQETMPIEPTPPTELSKDVEIHRVRMKQSTIDRTIPVTHDHPEYIGGHMGDDPYGSAEGKVYKNDRTISIKIHDRQSGEDVTFTFGFEGGTYNRFLYINPHGVSSKIINHQYGYTFSCTAGAVINFPGEYENEKEMYKQCQNFVMRRTADLHEAAEYIDPKHPGAVWFTSAPCNEPVAIDVVVRNANGGIMYLLRLWVGKDSDGAYYFANLENCNLLDQPNGTYTKDEVKYIFDMAAADMKDSDKITMLMVHLAERGKEYYLIDYREAGKSTYYNYFLPYDPNMTQQSSVYRDFPIIAVTMRKASSEYSLTLYYQVIEPPKDGEHGYYTYLGRDWLYSTDIDSLQGQGYPGMD